MTYDFDKLINRRGTHSYKWDSATDADILPLWVADMDFATAPVITDALRKRVDHGIFGYTKVPHAYYDAVVNWFKKRHKWSFSADWILYTSGVVPAISAIIKALTLPGDQVIVQGPVYNCFFSSIRNNGCEIVSNRLVYRENHWNIDFADLEQKAANPKARVLLLCNPHNPVGRVWTKEELTRMGEICLKHHVRVIVDEIHCEIVPPGKNYTPYGSLSEELMHNAIICNSPSKAFNTAGLQIANIICDNAETRNRINRAININEVCDVNPFGVVALMAAYTDEGAAWLDQLNSYLYSNYQWLCQYMAAHLPQLKVSPLEATYLAWIDCSALAQDAHTIAQHLLEHNHVWVSEGDIYGQEGDHFLRVNMACPRSRLAEGLQRIAAGIAELQAEQATQH